MKKLGLGPRNSRGIPGALPHSPSIHFSLLYVTPSLSLSLAFLLSSKFRFSTPTAGADTPNSTGFSSVTRPWRFAFSHDLIHLVV
ncbi:hypothetical protein AAHA92_03760 [Salvia divinorum]|uniref:Uncharacterized protein n=1 Tax=Salvia divinorum TaxID=28513 RepID=A0ABD1HX08_SALDI